MRVAVFCTTPEDGYSGGRYHAWMMAEALALGGNEVHFVTDHVPIFYQDLAACPRHSDLQLHLASDFAKGLPTGVFDAVVLVPGTLDARFYLRSRLFALEREARLADADTIEKIAAAPLPNFMTRVDPERLRAGVERRHAQGHAVMAAAGAS